jgi:hypothetical protein
MQEEKKHPELRRLLNAAGRIIDLAKIGEYATASFWIRFSADCGFLEFSDNFGNELGWRLKIVFYPSGETMKDIREIILVGEGEIWSVSTSYFHTIKRQIVHSRPHIQYHWSICDESDIAPLDFFQVGSLDELGYGSVSYGRPSRGGVKNKWSHGTTPAYPWTQDTPETLRDGEDTLIKEVCSVPVIPQISIKESVDRILTLGKFAELEEQLKELRKKCQVAA